MRIAVTGAAGFLGVNLLDVLADAGHDVTAIDHGIGPLDALDTIDGVTWVEGDVLDAGRMRTLFEGVDLVFHLAARISLRQEDPATWHLNTVGVRTVAEAALAARVTRLVHCSSVHSFDVTAGRQIDEASPRAVSTKLPIYDRSKYAGERELALVIERGLDAVIVNPTGVFGPLDHPTRLSRMNGILRDAAAGRVPVDMAGGFDWVDVRDVARGLVLASVHGRTGQNYLVGGNFLSMHDALKTAANVVGRRGPVLTFPLGVLAAIMPIAEPIGQWIGSDVMSGAALASLMSSPRVDHSTASAELEYTARPAEETIRDLIASFVQLGVLDRTKRPTDRSTPIARGNSR